MITGPDRIKLADYIVRSERTVLRVYQGRGSSQSREAVRRGALALGLPLPPEPSSRNSPEPSPTSSKAA
jgi:hypothetical protein